MIHQYNPGRFRYATLRDKAVRIGTIAAGTIVRLAGGRGPGPDLVMVEAWIPRDYHAHHRDAAGRWQSVRMAGGHLAQVRSLRNGRRYQLAEQWLRDPEDF